MREFPYETGVHPADLDRHLAVGVTHFLGIVTTLINVTPTDACGWLRLSPESEGGAIVALFLGPGRLNRRENWIIRWR